MAATRKRGKLAGLAAAATRKKRRKPAVPTGDYAVGYGRPPVETRFGQPRAPKRGDKPKTAAQLKKLGIEVGAEILPNGLTVIRNLFREMATGDNPQDHKTFLAYTFGAAPTVVELTAEVNDRVEVYDYSAAIAPIVGDGDAGEAGEGD
jgi:hypothetical protein